MDCSFCRRSAQDVQKLIAGPTVYICDQCTSAAVSILAGETVDLSPALTLSPNPKDICSFCMRPKPMSLDLLIGSAANICGACLEVCCSILAEEKLDHFAAQARIDALKERNRRKGWSGSSLRKRLFHA